MFSINAKLHKIILPKRTRNNYYVNPIIIQYSSEGKPQLRYMQCVTPQAKEELSELTEGDNVVVRVTLKGTVYNEKCFNLDEVISIVKFKQ